MPELLSYTDNRFARAGALMRPFEEGIGVGEVLAPCRSIPVTDEMRARDAAARADRDKPFVSPWRAGLQLSADNLRRGSKPGLVVSEQRATKARASAAAVVRKAQRELPARRVEKPAAAAGPLCLAGCGRRVRESRAKLGVCSLCARQPKVQKVAAEAEVALDRLPEPVPIVQACPELFELVLATEDVKEHQLNQVWAGLEPEERLLLLDDAPAAVFGRVRQLAAQVLGKAAEVTHAGA